MRNRTLLMYKQQSDCRHGRRSTDIRVPRTEAEGSQRKEMPVRM